MKKFAVIAVILVAAVSMAQRGGGQGGQRGFAQNNNTILGVLQRADVQGELKLTDDQKSKLEALRPQRGQRGQGGGGAGGGGGQGGNFDPAEMRKAQQEREKNTLAILDAGQNKRLMELFIQKAGNRSLFNETVAKELALTDDQKSKLQGLQTKQREAMQAVREKMQNGEIDRTQIRELQAKNDKIMDEEAGKILTTEQAAKLKTMRGAEFKFVEPAADGGL